MKDKELSLKQKKELKKIFERIPGFYIQGKLGLFFDNYLICESLARKIVLYGSGEVSKPKFQNLRYDTLKKCMTNFNLLDKKNSDFISEIFLSKSGKNEKKTPRQLRNGYFHGLNENSRKEIEERSSELIDLMEKFKKKFESL